jgi:peptide-methionine (R)-S-oxide reductase
MHRRRFISLGLGALAGSWLAACRGTSLAGQAVGGQGAYDLSAAQWRARLTPAQFHILREAGTEPAFSSPLDKEMREGIYHCAGCDLPLFSSATKYHSGTGWPSFWAPLPGAIATRVDRRFMMARTEVHCRRCGGHLGHVFPDGPPPTGLRYCVNGLALLFVPNERL